jgi:2,4-dienoyl-CoA reductase-like NADH-dependent reductase (Old Yellow Enzyme family)
MTNLNSPLTLPCGATLSGRLMKSAMTEGLASPTGQVSDELCRLYRCWSLGGAPVLVTGNVMIDGRYLERPGNLVVDADADRAGLRRLAEAGTANGNHLWMQINHPGRQCSRLVNGRPVSASDVQLNLLANFARPRPLREEEIVAVIEGFARTAAIARETGFTGVQVHAAHGYLISQFLSPLTNRREDRWGGALENRARLLLDCVQAVRTAVGDDFPLAVKLNSADFQRGGFGPDESERVALMLEALGIDLLEISGGTYEQPQLLGLSGNQDEAERPRAASTRAREAYFLDYARSMRSTIRVPRCRQRWTPAISTSSAWRGRCAWRRTHRAGCSMRQSIRCRPSRQRWPWAVAG